MKNKTTIIVVLVCAICCLLGDFPISQSFAKVQGLVVGNNCSCNACRDRRRIRRKCPKCQHDYCVLSCKSESVSRNCFDVDQEIVCIPKITWPWQKCCNPCAKTRTVNVLRVKKYECLECKYKWSVNDVHATQSSGQTPEPLVGDVQPTTENAAQPQFEPNELYDPGGSDVPQPPQQRGKGN